MLDAWDMMVNKTNKAYRQGMKADIKKIITDIINYLKYACVLQINGVLKACK